jgi:hypothetical protein
VVTTAVVRQDRQARSLARALECFGDAVVAEDLDAAAARTRANASAAGVGQGGRGPQRRSNYRLDLA